MTTSNATQKLVLSKRQKILSLSERMHKLRSKIEKLSEELTLDIADGYSSGDDLFDFVLVSGDGVFNDFGFNIEYVNLNNFISKNSGKTILVVQVGTYTRNEAITLIRNIFLANLRDDKLRPNAQVMTMSIPVEPNYLQWKEATINHQVAIGKGLVNKEWLEVGPLCSAYSSETKTKPFNNKGHHHVPEDTPCCIELLPHENTFGDFGIDSKAMAEMLRTWTRLKS